MKDDCKQKRPVNHLLSSVFYQGKRQFPVLFCPPVLWLLTSVPPHPLTPSPRRGQKFLFPGLPLSAATPEKGKMSNVRCDFQSF